MHGVGDSGAGSEGRHNKYAADPPSVCRVWFTSCMHRSADLGQTPQSPTPK